MRKYYRIIDNHQPKRNVAILAMNEDEALDYGRSLLKTANIRSIELKNKPKVVNLVTPNARRQL